MSQMCYNLIYKYKSNYLYDQCNFFCIAYGFGNEGDNKLATAVTSGFLLLAIGEREICVECLESLRHNDFHDSQANAVNTLNNCLGK
jgi:hypothetical protein